ncbi:MAG: ATP-binding protein [Gammaproteobacteria bacterium]|nr:ATP-binding protein [Gammaproteobacteria bacterium]
MKKSISKGMARDNILHLLRTEAAGSNSSSRQALLRLLLLRLLVTILSIVGALIFNAFSPLVVPLTLIGVMVTVILISVILGYWRLRRKMVISQRELFGHLVMDVIFLVVIVYYTGGASNPLISYLLVLLAVGATLLTQFYVNIFATTSIALYSFFLFSELQTEHTDHLMANFQLHLVGMWVTFVVSALLITLFVTRMAEAIRSRELTLAKARENEMRNEQLVAIGTLAAGTAHALGTPLSTMAVLLTDMDKMSEEQLRNSDIKPDISLLKQQVMRCKDSLSQLTRFYNKSDARHPESGSLGTFMEDIRDYIVNIHPRANIRFTLGEGALNARISTDLTLRHAVINLIENAIRAARSLVTVTASLTKDDIHGIEITVGDDGPGIPESVMENMGEPFISTRKDSMGLGIFLANAAIQRSRGSIEMFNRKAGGATSIIHLPQSTSDATAQSPTGDKR